MNKLNIEDCQRHALAKDGLCLDTNYINNKMPMEWQCKFGHKWRAAFGDVVRGRWCPRCVYEKQKHTIEECQVLAYNNSGECLSKTYNNNKEILIWKCANGHSWSAPFNRIQQGYWCPTCGGKTKHTIEQCRILAEDRGGKCLSVVYSNTDAKLEWMCQYGHIWHAGFHNISGGSWCPYCSHSIKHTIEDCQKFAQNKGGGCLDYEYVNTHNKMSWKCSNGHTWFANFNNILSGNWCPECKTGKTQLLLKNICEDIFPNIKIKCDQRPFDWLRYKDRLEIDIWIPALKLAIEYDGEQHFMPVRYGGISNKVAQKNFREQKKRDKRKDDLILKHSREVNKFIRFNFKEPITKEYVMCKLLDNGIVIK